MAGGSGALAAVPVLTCLLWAAVLPSLIVFDRRRLLRLERQTVQAEMYSAEVGFYQFLLESIRIIRIGRFWGGWALALVLLVSQLSMLFTLSAGAVVCLLGVSMLLASGLYDLLAGALVDMPALRAFRRVAFETDHLLLLRFKLWLFEVLPNAFALIALGVLDVSNHLSLVWVVGIVMLAWVAFSFLFTRQVLSWLYRLTPLAATSWAAAAARAQAWAQLLGVPLPPLLVMDGTPGGAAGGGLVGTFRPVLVVSADFLAHSDWRQQDSVIVLALTRLRSSTPLQALLSQLAKALVWFLFLVSGLFGVKACLLVTTLLRALLADPQERAPGLMVILVGMGILVLLLVRLRRRLKEQSSSPQKRLTPSQRQRRVEGLEQDRVTIQTTGDPLALIIALHTIYSLVSAPIDWQRPLNVLGLLNARQASTPTIPTLAERLQAIDQWMLQPGPRAPWADAPVPADMPVELGSRVVTIPLEEAPPPAPVPTIPYQSVVPA